MYAADHLPSHFHVRMHDEREALIGIADLSILSGRIARRELLEALAWAEQNPSRVGQFFFRTYTEARQQKSSLAKN